MTETALAVRPESLTPEKALALVKEHPEQAANLLMAVIRRDTAALPDTAFVRRADGTFLKKQRAGLRLKASAGQLVKISRYVDGEWLNDYEPSLEGLRQINRMAAVQIIRPESVIVDGQTQMNPYIQVDPQSRMPEVVYARCIAVGYSPMGSLCATDATIRLDINIYLLENIQAKMKKLKQHADRVGVYGTKENRPEGRGWVFMPIHSVGGIGMWVNLEAPEAQEILRDHTTRAKFIERLAQSFAERNALKAHPAIPQVANIDVDRGIASVIVDSWTSDFDRTEIDRLRDLIEHDRLHEYKRDDKVIDVVEVEATTDSEAVEILAGEEASERAADPPPGDDDEERDDGASAGLLAQATDLFSQLIDLTNRGAAKKMLQEHGIDNLEEATDDELEKFIDAASDKIGAGA